MSDESRKTSTTPTPFAAQVGAKASRKLRARRQPNPGIWLGLGMMGLIGWSVTVPMLLGTALGLWLDKQHSGSHSRYAAVGRRAYRHHLIRHL